MYVNLSFDEGGVERKNNIFICENNRKSNKIMHCVDFFLVVALKIWAFFTYFNLDKR